MAQARLLYPGLARFYAAMLPVAETFVRLVVAAMFLMHVSGKYHVGAGAVAANIFAKNGMEPALAWAYLVWSSRPSAGPACSSVSSPALSPPCSPSRC